MMSRYDLRGTKTDIATFIAYTNGYYTFVLENGDEIVFEEINKRILEDYRLKDKSLQHKKFKITYTEIIEDEDDEDLMIYRLEKIVEL